MRTIKLTIMYDGAAFAGWQRQPACASIQGVIEDALRKMTGETVNLIGASRTDAGAHALGQVAHFKMEADIPCEGIASGLSSMIGKGIVILKAEEMPDGFHARNDAKGKIYTYRLLCSKERMPLMQERCWHLFQMPDLDLMWEVSRALIGEHDFASFRASGCSSRDAIRRIDWIEISLHEPALFELAGRGQIIDITVQGNGFVRHMVRNIVGTLVDIGCGKIERGELQQILRSRDREKAGHCAPASGLYLSKVIY